jgi:gliding motility-associated-like protein
MTSLCLFSQEICDNGIDDDMDGLIDYEDTRDCFCIYDYSLIPNHSFDGYNYCPNNISQMSGVSHWQSGSWATPDYYNTCDFTYIPRYFPPPLPIPEGSGYIGFFDGFSGYNYYKEYIAICLSDTLFSGEKYTIDFKIALGYGKSIATVGIFGSNNCANLPFSGNYGCPTIDSNFISLDTKTINTNNHSWQSSSFSFTAPYDITNFLIGSSCATRSGENYYYFDIVKLKKNLKGLKMPNVFSPNNDGMNDVFRPVKSNCIFDFTFFIYNRWGQLIYETNSLPISWDGTTKGENCSEGVYFWILKSNKDKQSLKGNISLFR